MLFAFPSRFKQGEGGLHRGAERRAFGGGEGDDLRVEHVRGDLAPGFALRPPPVRRISVGFMPSSRKRLSP